MAEARGKNEKPVEAPSFEGLKRKAGALKAKRVEEAGEPERIVEGKALGEGEERKAFKGLQESLFEAKDRVARIVALISEINDIEREKEDSANDVKALKKKLDEGSISKFAFLQLMDKNKLRIDGLNQEKKELLKAANNEMNELRKAFSALKDLGALRAELENIGKLE